MLWRLAHNTNVTERKRVFVVVEDGCADRGINKIHFGNHANRAHTKGIDFAAGTQSRRICKVNVGGAYRENDVGFLNVLVTQVLDLLT